MFIKCLKKLPHNKTHHAIKKKHKFSQYDILLCRRYIIIQISATNNQIIKNEHNCKNYNVNTLSHKKKYGSYW